MKEKTKKAVLCLLIASLVLCIPACSNNKQDVYFLPDISLSDYYEVADSFSFNILFLYTGNLSEIELVSVNSSGGPLNWTEFSYASCDEFASVDGYKMGYVNIIVPCLEDVTVTSAALLVNGTEKTINFDGPKTAIKHSPDLYPDVSGIMGSGIPTLVCCDGDSADEIEYSFKALENITVSSFDFTGIVGIDSAIVSIDETEIGQLEDVLPVNVSKDSTIKIRVEKASFGSYKYSDFSSSVILEYSLGWDNKVREYFDTINFYSITTQEVFEEFVREWEKDNK